MEEGGKDKGMNGGRREVAIKEMVINRGNRVNKNRVDGSFALRNVILSKEQLFCCLHNNNSKAVKKSQTLNFS